MSETETNGNNGISKKRELTCQRIIKALGETNGLLTLAARRAGVSYRTVNRYANDFPSVQEAVQLAKESIVDLAEGQLYKKIVKGDTACIIFFLKTKGKTRGYIERQEISGADGNPIDIEHTIIVKSEKDKTNLERVLNGERTGKGKAKDS